MSRFTPEFYEDDDGREPVLDWLRGLAPHKRRAATAAIENILAEQGPGICGSSWGKWVQGVAGSIFELRIRWDYGTIMRNAGLTIPGELAEEAEESHDDVLLRVFCHAYGDRIVMLLAAYDKGEEPSDRRQNKEAQLADRRLKQWKQRENAKAKAAKRKSSNESTRKGKNLRKKRS